MSLKLRVREDARRDAAFVLLEVAEEPICVFEQIIEILSDVLHCPLPTVIFLIFEGLIVSILPFEQNSS